MTDNKQIDDIKAHIFDNYDGSMGNHSSDPSIKRHIQNHYDKSKKDPSSYAMMLKESGLDLHEFRRAIADTAEDITASSPQRSNAALEGKSDPSGRGSFNR